MQGGQPCCLMFEAEAVVGEPAGHSGWLKKSRESREMYQPVLADPVARNFYDVARYARRLRGLADIILLSGQSVGSGNGSFPRRKQRSR